MVIQVTPTVRARIAGYVEVEEESVIEVMTKVAGTTTRQKIAGFLQFLIHIYNEGLVGDFVEDGLKHVPWYMWMKNGLVLLAQLPLWMVPGAGETEFLLILAANTLRFLSVVDSISNAVTTCKGSGKMIDTCSKL